MAPLWSAFRSTLTTSASPVSSGRSGPCARPPAGPHHQPLVARGRRRRAGFRQRLDERHVAGQRIGARRAYLADDEDALAAVLLHRDGDLRVGEVAVRQPRLQLEFDLAQAQASGLHAADQREGEGPVGFHGELAVQVGLVPDGDRQHVLRTDHVVR
jgi:hypothetical protein